MGKCSGTAFSGSVSASLVNRSRRYFTSLRGRPSMGVLVRGRWALILWLRRKLVVGGFF